MSNAYTIFRKTIDRCNKLVALYNNQKAGTDPKGNCDLLRAAVVLSVAAMDAYMTNCFAEHFYTFINNEEINENIEKRLLDYGVTIGTVIEMYRDNQSLSGIQDKVYQYYEHYTTQRMKVIDELFALYGLPKITENAQGKSQDEALLKDVEKLVDRRNAIVHKGDYKKNEIKSISVKDAENIKKIELLVKNIEEIVENRFKRFETAEK